MSGATKRQIKILSDKELEHSFSIDSLQGLDQYASTFCRVTYNRIFFIISGSGTLFVDDQQFRIAGAELFLLGKGQLFSFVDIKDQRGYEISFGDCFWEKSPASAHNCKSVLFNNAAANQHILLSENDHLKLRPLFDTLYQEHLGEIYVNKLDALAAYLKIIMIKIANINAALVKGLDTYERQLYRQFIEVLSKQYLQTHEVAAYALQLGITARKLTDLCKSTSGKGAKEIIDGHIISEAKRSLQFSAKPIKEIAYYLNFSSPERFSHFFKRMTQISPDHYRSQFVEIDM